ncbi:hypothetical protein SBOR_4644 [Sclerotinia borealis F-4128]|uniref:Uncharacterized protein n=1 Tax=Sclerotinia borealis (strain F-4128) TaxID=1432307 RepID=W9CGG2_SCLBF|nr:hypothetical protein SBOR_4644 [Sclerotinia borealis F-4128]
MHTPVPYLSYLTLTLTLSLFHSTTLAHLSIHPSQNPLTTPIENPIPSQEKCLSYSATFLSPYTEGALEPHAVAQLPGFCEGLGEKVALHPSVVDGWGWVMDFSAGCGCDGKGGDGDERFWVYFPVEVVEVVGGEEGKGEGKDMGKEKDNPSSLHAVEKAQKKKCHDKKRGKQIEKEMEMEWEVEITEPWILHAEGCENNRGDPEINAGLGTCEEGVQRMWKMGVEREDWRELRGDGGMVWVVQGWDLCRELKERLGSVEG